MATMQDVARRAHVAVSTVSYALSGTRPVSRETAERIRRAMDELDYEPNAMARGLARRRSHTLAMTFPEFDTAMGETVFEIVRGAQRGAAAVGYDLAVWPVDEDRAGQDLATIVRQGKADGVLLVEVGVDDPRVAPLVDAQVPFVLIGRTRDPRDFAYVDIDFEKAIEDAVESLHVLGHRRICLVGRPEKQVASGYGPAVRARDAFAQAMKRRGLEATMVACAASPVAGRALAHHLGELPTRPSGVVVLNDMAVPGLTAGFNEMGLAVPRDVSVIGAVSSRTLGAMTNPRLTTSHAPGERMGACAARALVKLLDGEIVPTECQHLVGCEVVAGESVGPAPGDDAGGAVPNPPGSGPAPGQ